MTRHQLFSVLSATSAFILLLGIAWTIRAQDEDAAPVVRLIVDYGDDVEKQWNAIAWREGITVLDAILQAGKYEHPLKLGSDLRGRGEQAFVRGLDGLENEGGGRDKRNWIFRVNGELGERSCGVTLLEASDVVRWSFQTYNMDDEE